MEGISADPSCASSILAEYNLSHSPTDMSVLPGKQIHPNGPMIRLRKLGELVVATLQTLLPLSGSVLDKADAPYWQALPLRRMVGVLLALFFTFSGIGFFVDLIAWWRLPLWALFSLAGLIGASGVVFFAVLRRRRFKLAPLLVLLIVAVIYAIHFLPHGAVIPVTAAAHRRMVIDGIGIYAAALLGYRFFLRFISVAGIEQIRARTELELAHGIQQTLVPAIDCTTDSVEVYGLSLPSEEVGGDLVDFVPTEGGWLGWLADVSGHGIKAGVLMGNLKTALRFALVEGHSLPMMLNRTNRVLPAVKDVEMYATVAAVRSTQAGAIEYALAGHLPILHYHATEKRVNRCGMEQFPLGLIPESSYESATLKCETGDILALLSDGIVETEDASGAEFGLERIERVLRDNGAASLKDITNRIVTELACFGTRNDDQSLLLMRFRSQAER